MKSWLMLSAAAVMLAGCGSTVTRDDLDATNKTVEDLRLEMVNKNELQTHLYNALIDANKGVLERIVALESSIKALRAELDQLRMEVKTARAASPDGGQPPASTASPAQPAVPKRTIEDIWLEAEAALSNMRAGRLTPAEVAAQLKPWAAEAAPYLVTEIRKAVADIKFQAQIETILGAFPPGKLRAALADGLKYPGSRFSVPNIVATTRDAELSTLLAPHATSEEESFRLEVGQALVKCGNPDGILALVSCLKSSDRSTQFIALTSLKGLTRGNDFGFRPGASAADNAAALKAWEDWGKQAGKGAFKK